ncbi:hypothetical protein LSUE1_G003404 [Lachnellula suecica]|uniref:GPI-anchored protein n=1 Tax=Lachnellula suecica TaxID=602035 RepID=A0A8T9CAT5_9HELO|nr:hypothetical protein LSUE1_G003404 [Lachnellula suecica]
MWSKTLTTSLFLLPIAALQLPSVFAPFYEPSLLISNETLLVDESHELLKRDGSCPANYGSCSTLNAKYGGACCTAGSICTTDKAKNIACCPTGASCTGTLTQAASATTTGSGTGIVLGGTTGTGSTTTATTTTTGATATIPGAASYVTNQYFPFPIIATSYSNSAACNSAFQACQTNYAACTADLAGGGSGFAVTIVAPAGGVTVSPTIQSLGAASATSICSSLSSEACYNIQSSNCAQFGDGSGGSFVVSSTKNAAARQTVGCMAAAGMMAGVGLGIAGQMV